VKKNLMGKPYNETLVIGKECLEYFDEKKAVEPLLMDLRKINSYLDFFLIATGNSQIHCRSLARDTVKFLTAKGLKEYGKHDLNSEWIILDFGDLIVHIFTEEMRTYYQLEKLWADAEKFELK
jgi:ribosome-associated protein